MKCKTCKKVFVPKSHAHNIKFCSVRCRNKAYQAYQTNWTRNKRNSIADKPTKNKIKCLVCGRWYKQVGSHIVQVHEMFARDYREAYGFDVKRGQLPNWLRTIKADYVFENGTIKNLKKGRKYWFKPGSKTAGRYERSQETLNRLKHLNK